MPSPTVPAPAVSPVTDRAGVWVRERDDPAPDRWRVHDGTGRRGIAHRLSHPPTAAMRALAQQHHAALPLTLDLLDGAEPTWVTSRPRGERLDHRLARGNLADEVALDVLGAVADALALCHRTGTAHGAVDPRHVYLQASTAQLTGFECTGPDASAADDVRQLGELARMLWPGDTAPEWLSTLILECTAEPAGHRPSAARIADAAISRGATLPTPTEGTVRARAHALHIEIAGVHEPVRRWVERGGTLAVVGPDGAGRTYALDVAARHAYAHGVPFVVLHPSMVPWGSVAAALDDSGLPGLPESIPDGVDQRQRAHRAVDALLARAEGRLRILVDDVHSLDNGTRCFVETARDRGASVLVAGATPPSWAHQIVHLEEWPETRATELATHVAGLAALDPAPELARPGRILDHLCTAIRTGALTWRTGSLSWTGPRTSVPNPASTRWSTEGLDPDARELGAWISLAGPTLRTHALRTITPPETARDSLQRLLDEGWLRGTHTVRVVSDASRRALADACRPIEASYRGMIRQHEDGPSLALGAALVGARDVAGIESRGAACVHAARSLEPEFAAELAQQMMELAPSPALVTAHMDACVDAGWVDVARSVGTGWLEERAPETSDLPVLVRLAELARCAGADPESVFTWTRQARAVLAGHEVPVALALAETRAWLDAGDPAAAESTLAPLVAQPLDVDDPTLWLRIRETQARMVAASEGPTAGIALLDAVPADLAAHTYAWAELGALHAELLAEQGTFTDAATRWTRAAQHSEVPTSVRDTWERYAAAAWTRAGQPARAAELLERLTAESRDPAAALRLARASVALGRYDTAEHWAQIARPAQPATATVVLAAVAVGRRSLEQAARACERAEALGARDGDDQVLVEASTLRAEIAVIRREPDALGLAIHAHNAALQLDDAEASAVCDGLRAVLAARSGHRRSVEQFVAQALRTAVRIGAPDVMARVRLWIAEARLAMGQRDIARQLAEEVARDVEPVGLRPLAQWARRLATWSTPGEATDDQHAARVSDCTLRIARVQHVDDVLTELTTAAMDLCRADAGLVLQVVPQGFDLRASAGAVSDPPEDVAERVRDVRQPLAVHQAGRELVVGAPLIVEETVWGAVLITCRRVEPDAPRLVDDLRVLAAHASLALARAAAEERRNQNSQRLREVAHDLRSPLAGIGTLARSAVLDGAGLSSEDAAVIVDAADHALSLVESEWARPEPTLLDWTSEIEQWVRSLEPIAAARGCELALDLADHGVLRGSATQLRRVVTNLVENAIRYSSSGDTVRISTFGEPSWVGVQIDDDGPGLHGDTEHLFEPGYQGPGAQTGQGLGLSIVRRICEEHGGDVTAEEREGGSRFIVRLPRASQVRS